MKTITMDYTEYKSELVSAHFRGQKEGSRRMIAVLKAFNSGDFREAHTILFEDMESQGHDIFISLSKDNIEAQKWLVKEGLWKEERI